MTRASIPSRVAALAALAFAAAGCQQHFGTARLAAPPEYEQRHPILLTRSTQTATIEVGTHHREVTGVQQADVAGFARSFRADGEGAIAINVPSGTVNEVAAVGAARQIRRILEENGVPAGAIAARPYRGEEGVPAPPVVLSYTRLRATVPHRCALSTDVDMGPDRQQWDNFGCATQQNLAAMVSNPNDLQGPRPFDRPYAHRRYRVLEAYGRGEDPSSQQRNENAGAVSRVGQ
jgi:pilus assembly protein CpaD